MLFRSSPTRRLHPGVVPRRRQLYDPMLNDRCGHAPTYARTLPTQDQFEDLRALIRERHSTAPSELAPPSAAATAAGVAKTEARRSRAPSMASPLPEADSIAQLLADREELSSACLV